MEFKSWFQEQSTLGTEYVDERQVDMLYNKAKYAVKLVQMYDSTLAKGFKLLPNISVIASLSMAPNILGLFNSAENQKVISQKAAEKIKFKFVNEVIQNHTINKIPQAVIKKYIPDINTDEIQQSDVIHVDVKNILRIYGDTPEAIIQIASTIVHECTHELEKELTGHTEDGPGTAVEKAEEKFQAWIERNKTNIAQRIPQIGLKISR